MPSYEDVKKTSVTVLMSTAEKLKAMAGQRGYELERPVYMAEVVRELIAFYEEKKWEARNANPSLEELLENNRRDLEYREALEEAEVIARFKELNPHLRSAGDPEPEVEAEPLADTVEVEPEQADVTEEMTVQKYEPAPEVEPEEKPAPPKWVPGQKFGNPIR